MVFDSALSEWRCLLGEAHCIVKAEAIRAYSSSVCGSERRIPCVLRPGSTEDVQGVVEIANRCGVPVYPFSIGCNWGMGSRLPAQDNCALLDLSRMNRILEINPAGFYARIEPGVSQRQLYQALNGRNLPLMFNVTGSSGDTSIIGNALDRGVGYFSSRAESLSGMEVVLGNGRVIRTGFAHYPQARTAAIYRHGVGPSLDGLFAQSNFGVVTSAYFELMPKPSDHMAVIAKIDDERKLPSLIDALADLRRQDSIRTVAHVGNKARSEVTLAPLVWEQLRRCGFEDGAELRRLAVKMLQREGFGPWSAVVGVLGTPAQLRVARREIKAHLRGIASTVFLNDRAVALARSLAGALDWIPLVRRKRVMLESVMPLYEITKGIPTDAPLKSVYWPAGDYQSMDEPNPDLSGSGMIYCLPILPIDGDTVARVMGRTSDLFAQYGFDAYITVNLMDSRAMECVVSLGCDRSNRERMDSARRCIDEMEAEYVREGYIPYRVGIDSARSIAQPQNPFWQTVAELKHALDPNGIMAPGKYGIAAE